MPSAIGWCGAAGWPSRLRGPTGDHEGQLQPLERSVDVGEPGIAQPFELQAQLGETVGQIVLDSADQLTEPQVGRFAGGCDQIEVGEHAARTQKREDLVEERALAVIG